MVTSAIQATGAFAVTVRRKRRAKVPENSQAVYPALARYFWHKRVFLPFFAPILLAILLLSFGHASAQRIGQPSESLIRIVFEPTRPQLTVGPGFGVVAEIKNVSNSDTVYIWEGYTVLIVPPELWDPSKRNQSDPSKPDPWAALWGYFPSDVRPENVAGTCVALQPGDTYSVFWNIRSEGQSKLLGYLFNQIKSELYFMFFSPGSYKLTVQVQYWTSPTVKGKEQPYRCHGGNPTDPNKLNDYRAVAQTVTLPVAAPQSVTLFGAAIGGLIGYWILPAGRRRLMTGIATTSRTAHWILQGGRVLLGSLGAVVLAMIVTILLSRIADTQFFIRVTVADLWGAIAVGFIASYIGAKVLDSILKSIEQRPPDG